MSVVGVFIKRRLASSQIFTVLSAVASSDCVVGDIYGQLQSVFNRHSDCTIQLV